MSGQPSGVLSGHLSDVLSGHLSGQIATTRSIVIRKISTRLIVPGREVDQSEPFDNPVAAQDLDVLNRQAPQGVLDLAFGHEHAVPVMPFRPSA
jgi:hypothetical protein